MLISDRVIFMKNGHVHLDTVHSIIRHHMAAERVRRFMGEAGA